MMNEYEIGWIVDDSGDGELEGGEELLNWGIWIKTGLAPMATLFGIPDDDAADWGEDVFGGDTAAAFTWLRITPEFLKGNYYHGGRSGTSSPNGLAMTPAQILKSLFGDLHTLSGTNHGSIDASDYSGGMGVERSSADNAETGVRLYAREWGGVDPNSDEFYANYGSNVMGNVSTCYVGQAVIAYMPGMVPSGREDDIYGFLDSHSGFGYTYEWDVFSWTVAGILNASERFLPGADTGWASHQTGTRPEEVLSAWGTMIAVEGMYTYPPHATGTPESPGMDASSWQHMIGSSTTYHRYPPKADEVATSWKNQSLGATTYCLEAVGIDYLDTFTDSLEPGTNYGKSAGSANQLLSSNEIYPVTLRSNFSPLHQSVGANDDGGFQIQYGPPPGDDDNNYSDLLKIRFCGGGTDVLGKFSYDPGDVSAAAMSSAALKIMDRSALRGLLSIDDEFAGKGGAELASKDGLVMSLLGNATQYPQPWVSRYGTHKWEKQLLDNSIIRMCREVEAQYEVVDLPKKLLNKVQKRKNLPNSSLSAFGLRNLDDDAYTVAVSRASDTGEVTVYAGETISDYDSGTVAAASYTGAGEGETGISWGGMTWDEYLASET